MRRSAIVLVLVALWGVGCGTGEPERSGAADAQPAQPAEPGVITEAAERTRLAGSARVETTLVLREGGTSFITASEGVIDFAGDRARFDMGDPTAGFTADDEITATTIMDGDVYYTRSDLASPTPWVRSQYDGGPGGAVDVGLFGIGQPRGRNPAERLAILGPAIEAVSLVRREEVRGVETTRYAGVLDLDRVVAQVPEERQASTREGLLELDAEELVITVWIGDDGLVRQMRHTVDALGPDPADDAAPVEQPSRLQAPGRATITVELFDFGVEAAITPPPEEDVTNFIDLDDEGPPVDDPVADH